MLGEKRYFLDTNAMVALLQGDDGVLNVVRKADWLGISVINVFEFLGFRGLSDADRALFLELVSRLHVVDVSYADAALMTKVIQLRRERTVKLPDAIVLASASTHSATLITQDVRLLTLAAKQHLSAASF